MEEWMIILLRTIGLFILLILFMPLLGRKPISGMTMFDYLQGLVIAGFVALISLNVVTHLGYGLLALAVWVGLILIVQYLVLRSKVFHDYIYGKELVVIKEGKVLEENLKAAKLTAEELLSQLRRWHIFQVADVEFAVMESNGDISALKRHEKQPVTAELMQKEVRSVKEPQTVILDGKIMDEPLTAIGVNREWLFQEITKKGLSVENVFIGQVNEFGDLYVDVFDDALQLPHSSTKELLQASLKKAEADFLSYALATQDPTWKKKYDQHAQTINKMLKDLDPYFSVS